MDDQALAEIKSAIGEFTSVNTKALAETRETLSGLTERVDQLETRANRIPAGGSRRKSQFDGYSLARAIKMAEGGRLDGVEAEVHAELSKGRDCRGIVVPTELLLGGSETKSGPQLVLPDNQGGYMVSTEVGKLADRFRASLKVRQLGCTVLPNLTGFVDLPNLASSGSTHWITEHQATTRSGVAFSKVTLTPKTVSAQYEISRRLLLQSQEAMEAVLRRDLSYLLASAIDAAAIKNRTGQMSEPLGVLDSVWNVPKVTTETLFSDTCANLIASLELDDVSGTGAFLTNPKVMQVARKTHDVDNHVIPTSELFHNQRVEVSTQVPDNIGASSNKSALIFGLWSELIVGYWSGIDILADRYSIADKGGMLLHAFLDVDCAVRHSEAFAYAEI